MSQSSSSFAYRWIGSFPDWGKGGGGVAAAAAAATATPSIEHPTKLQRTGPPDGTPASTPS